MGVLSARAKLMVSVKFFDIRYAVTEPETLLTRCYGPSQVGGSLKPWSTKRNSMHAHKKFGGRYLALNLAITSKGLEIKP